jgi:hypothetical protein
MENNDWQLFPNRLVQAVTPTFIGKITRTYTSGPGYITATVFPTATSRLDVSASNDKLTQESKEEIS